MKASENQKLLSIIIPLYNVEKFIANCLDTILRQEVDFNDYTIIVVNDGSQDNGPKIVEDYLGKYDHIQMVSQPNGGLSAARNTGIAHAKTQYVYFIDSDDYITNDSLQPVVQALKEHKPDVLTVNFSVTPNVDDYTSSTPNVKNPNTKLMDGIGYISSHNYPNMSWWYFLRLDYLKGTDKVFPGGRICEDSNFTIEILFNAQKVVTLDLDFYRYYQRDGSITRKYTEEGLRKMIEAYRLNILEFNQQLEQFEKREKHVNLNSCLNRIKTRQESFIFFMIIRCLKLKMNKEELDSRILEMKELGLYPLTHFGGRDFNGLQYHLLTPMVNSSIGVKILHGLFRLLPNFYR